MTISALPVLNRTDPTFKEDVDTFFGVDIPLFSVQAEAARVEINNNTISAVGAANTAAAQADIAISNAELTGLDAVATAADRVQTGLDRAVVEAISVTAGVASVNGRTGFVTLTKSDVGLGAVDNTSDIDKPVSTLQAAAISAAGGVTNPLVVLAEKAVSLGVTASGGAGQSAAVALSATLDVVIMHSSSGLYAAAYDSVTGVMGSAVLVRAGNYIFRVSQIDAGKCLVTSITAGSTDLQAVVLSVSGTVVSVGTVASATLAGNLASQQLGHIVKIGVAHLLPYGRATNAQAIRAFTVSGTTVTIGAELPILGDAALAPWLDVIDATKAIVMTPGVNSVYAGVVTVTGATLTAGALSNTGQCTANEPVMTPIGKLASGRWALAYKGVDGGTWGSIVTVSGTTTSMTSVKLLTGHGYGISGAIVGSSALLWANTTGGNTNVLTDVSGAATAATAISAEAVTLNLAVSCGEKLFVGTGNTRGAVISIVAGQPVAESLALPSTGANFSYPGSFLPLGTCVQPALQTLTTSTKAIPTGVAGSLAAYVANGTIKQVLNTGYGNFFARINDSTAWVGNPINTSIKLYKVQLQ